MKKSGFKMKGSPMQRNFGISPAKQKPEGFNWTGSEEAKKSRILTPQEKSAKFKQNFNKFQAQKQKADKWVKNLKKGAKIVGGRALGVLGFMSGGALSATAGNTIKKSEGEQIKDLLKKFKNKSR